MDALFKLMGLDLVCEYLIKSSLILIFALFLVIILQKKSASLRYFILSFSLMSLILIPFLSSVSAGWETKLVPVWDKHKDDSSITDNWVHSSFIDQKDTKKIFLPNEEISIPYVSLNSASDNKGFINTGLDRENHIIFLIFPLLWILGLLFLWLKIVVGLNGASKLTGQGEVITKFPFQQILQQLCKIISLKRKVGLLSSRQILTPITWGVIKPVILLPESSKRWTNSQCSSVLFHELSHIKRGDFILKIVVRFICALFWFNPLVWIVYGSLKREQEKACDELVLNSGIKPSTYAANLLSIKLAEQRDWSPPAIVLEAFNRSQLDDRLIAILKKKIKPKEIKMKNKIFLSILFILVITVIGLARPEEQKKINGNNSNSADISINTTHSKIQRQNVQEIQGKKQEKKADEEKSKEQETQEKKEHKKGIKWVAKDGESGSAILYISDADEVKYITDDDEVKKIILDGKLILVEKEGEKKTFSIATDGKECVIKKDDFGNWTIDGKLMELSDEEGIKVIKLGDLKDVVIKKDEDGSWTITSNKLEQIKDGSLYVLKTDQDNQIVIQSKDSDSAAKIIKISVPKLFITMDKSGHKNLAIFLGEDIDELKEINASLISDHAVWLYADADDLEGLGGVCMIGYIKGKEGFQIIFKSDELDETQRKEYAELFEKIKNKLEGRYEVEKEINEEDNTFILNIKSETLDTAQKIDMKKLLNEIVEVIKEVKESKKEK